MRKTQVISTLYWVRSHCPDGNRPVWYGQTCSFHLPSSLGFSLPFLPLIPVGHFPHSVLGPELDAGRPGHQVPAFSSYNIENLHLGPAVSPAQWYPCSSWRQSWHTVGMAHSGHLIDGCCLMVLSLSLPPSGTEYLALCLSSLGDP